MIPIPAGMLYVADDEIGDLFGPGYEALCFEYMWNCVKIREAWPNRAKERPIHRRRKRKKRNRK